MLLVFGTYPGPHSVAGPCLYCLSNKSVGLAFWLKCMIFATALCVLATKNLYVYTMWPLKKINFTTSLVEPLSAVGVPGFQLVAFRAPLSSSLAT